MNLLRYLLLVAVLCACVPSSVHCQEPVWVKHYANGGQNSGLRLCWNGEDGLFGIGRLHGNATLDGSEVTVLGSADILLVRWDTTGNIIWARTAGGDCEPGDTDGGRDLLYEPVHDQLIATGYFSCPSTYFGTHVLNGSGPLSGIDDRFLAAYSPDGACVWTRKISAAELSLTYPLSDADGNIFLMGTGELSSTAFHGSAEVTTVPTGGFVAKYSNAGSLIHAERVLTNGNLRGSGWASSTKWHLCGSVKPGGSVHGQSIAVTTMAGEGFIALADTNGTMNWIKTFPSTGSSLLYKPVSLPDGSCAVSGMYTGDLVLPEDTLHGSASMYTSFVARLSDQGDLEWVVPFTAGGHALVYDLKLDSQGDILVYGRFEGNLEIGPSSITPASSKSGLLCRLGADGVIKAAMTFGRVPYGTGSVLPTNHGIYLSSEFDSTMTLGSTVIQGSAPSLGDDLFLARFDSLSGFTNVPTVMAPEGGGLVIYANPNEGRCTVELPKGIAPGSVLRLVVRDAQGQLVQEEPIIVSARGTVQLDISAQARGVYHVELLDERRRYTGKVVFE